MVTVAAIVLGAVLVTVGSANRPEQEISWQHDLGYYSALGCAFPGPNLKEEKISSQQCPQACIDLQGCTHFTYNPKAEACYLKQLKQEAKPILRPNQPGWMCGFKEINAAPVVSDQQSPPPPGTQEAAAEILLGLLDVAIKLAPYFSDKDTYRRNTDQYLLFEGNFCSENLAGSFWVDSNRVNVNAKKVAFIQNDEARSVLIQGPVPAGSVIWVCDHPTNCNDDDRTSIYVRGNIPSGQGYCVHTFERSYSDSWVHVRFYRKNGLDGKVSQIKNY